MPELVRRLALGVVLVGGPALFVVSVPALQHDTLLLAGIGDVTDRTAIVWVRAPGAGPVAVELGPASEPGRQRLLAEAAPEADFVVKRQVLDLAPGTRHQYRVTWQGVEVEGEFVTAPEPGAAAPVHLLWSGDLGGGARCRSPEHGYPIFGVMRERHPDLFLFLGDTVYADQRCPAPPSVAGADFIAQDLSDFRAKHRYNRADPSLRAFLLSTSVSAMWDDHEVRNNFAGPREPLMPVGRQAFLDYWPILPPVAEPGRLYRRAQWGRLMELFILDTRQYRSPNTTLDGPGKTMLGADQRNWLLAGLRGSAAVWKVVVSSVPLSIPTGLPAARDGWANGSTPRLPQGSPTGFEHELLGIVQEIGVRRIPNIVWLVTDVHHAEVIRHAPLPGLVFHELVAGPLSAGLGIPGFLDDTLRPTRLFAEGGYDNFGELTITEAGLTVGIVAVTGQIRFETTLAPRP